MHACSSTTDQGLTSTLLPIARLLIESSAENVEQRLTCLLQLESTLGQRDKQHEGPFAVSLSLEDTSEDRDIEGKLYLSWLPIERLLREKCHKGYSVSDHALSFLEKGVVGPVREGRLQSRKLVAHALHQLAIAEKEEFRPDLLNVVQKMLELLSQAWSRTKENWLTILWVIGITFRGLVQRGGIPSDIIHACLSLAIQHPVLEARSRIVHVLGLPLQTMLLRSTAGEAQEVVADLWDFTVKGLDPRRAIPDQCNAWALLCVTMTGLQRHLPTWANLWNFVCRGLNHEEGEVRMRALTVFQRLIAELQDQDIDHTQLQFWTSFVMAVTTCAREHEGHLLTQVKPLVFSLLAQILDHQPVAPGSLPIAHLAPDIHGRKGVPVPCPLWAEALLTSALNVRNIPLRRRYVQWMCSDMPRYYLGQLSIGFMLTHFLRASSNALAHRRDCSDTVEHIARTLAEYLKQLYQQSLAAHSTTERCRTFLVGMLMHARAVESSHVKKAILSLALYCKGIGLDSVPCLGMADLQLVRSLMAFITTTYNQKLQCQLLPYVLQMLRQFTDYQIHDMESGSENIASSLRLMLLELPLSILEAEHGQLQHWLLAFVPKATHDSPARAWWTKVTTKAFHSFLLMHGHPEAQARDAEHIASDMGSPTVTSLILALTFIPETREIMEALTPWQDVLGRVHTHAYIPAETRLRALALLRAMSPLVKGRVAADIMSVIVPVLSETAEHVRTVISHLLHSQAETGRVIGSTARMTGGDSTQGGHNNLWSLYVGCLGVIICLAGSDKRTACASAMLIEECLDIVSLPSDFPTGGRLRGIAVITRILRNIDSQHGCHPSLTRLFPQIAQSLAGVGPSMTGSLSGSERARLFDDVWACRACLFALAKNCCSAAMPPWFSAVKEQELLSAGLESSSRQAIPSILFGLSHVIVPYTWSFTDVSERLERLRALCLTAYTVVKDFNFELLHVQLLLDVFIQSDLLEDPCVLAAGPESPIHLLLNRLLHVGLSGQRSRLLLSLAASCFNAWRSKPSCAKYYAHEIVALLLTREPPKHMSQCPDEDDTSIADTQAKSRAALPHPLIRVSILDMLCGMLDQQEIAAELLPALLGELLSVAEDQETKQTKLISSPDYARRLCAWQAMAVLVSFVRQEGTVQQLNSHLWPKLCMITLPAIRHFQELVAGALCQAFPVLCVPLLLRHLQVLDLRPQVSASLLVIAGWAVLAKDAPMFAEEYRKPLLFACIPWLAGTHAVSRVMSQLLAFRMLTELREQGLEEALPERWDQTAVSGVFSFLSQHREMSRLREKELPLYQTFSLRDHCSVQGLLRLKETACGDLEPVPVVTALRVIMSKLCEELGEEDGIEREGRVRHQVDEDSWDAATVTTIQRKITVNRILQEELEEKHQDDVNARGVPLQDIVVCASLIDKVPNLAGLARTCEIFAVRTLAIPDLQVLKDPQFESISISAGQWIHIEEVREKQTGDFLARYRAKGYTAVALEQTSTSMCMSISPLPPKMVLLLGKEKEGIPIELLAEVDMCVEIPQQGLCRSLNAHVSGALIIWEYTRARLLNREPRQDAQQILDGDQSKGKIR